MFGTRDDNKIIMASQIAHIVYAKNFLENDHPSWINKDEFILGCVFPDIRRIDETISRKASHMHFEKVDLDFSGLNSFEAGWKFHLYCDMKREEILKKYDFFSLSNSGDFYGQAAKELEDKLIYNEYNNWEKLVHLFNNVPHNGNPLGVSHETMGLWYAIIANYIKEKPNSKSIHVFFSKQTSFVGSADGIVESIKELEQNKEVVAILKKVFKEII